MDREGGKEGPVTAAATVNADGDEINLSGSRKSSTPLYEDGHVTVCVRERPFLQHELRAHVAGRKATRDRQAGIAGRSEVHKPADARASSPVSMIPGTAEEGQRCLLFTDDGRSVRITEPAPELSADATDTTGYSALSPRPRGAVHTFCFDHAYSMAAPQAQVYEDIGAPVLAASLRGFNTCIFAYGQTGSGKSHSMMGADGGADVASDPGLVPRLCSHLFAHIAELEAGRDETPTFTQPARPPGDSLSPTQTEGLSDRLEFSVFVSYLEIYNEKVSSLLAESSPPPASGDATLIPAKKTTGRERAKPRGRTEPPTLRVRQHPTLGVFVEGLEEIPVTSNEEVLHWMSVGNRNRRTAATRMNDVSSRSHAVFALRVVQKHSTKTTDGHTESTERRAKMNLVDLAGSERARATGAEGETLREGAQINLSLTTLGRVIKALADLASDGTITIGRRAATGTGPPQTRHIPYRDSTLTFLLQESLGGSSKTYMLATVSPAARNYEETLSTLRYAERAKSIVNRAFVNESASDKRIRELENEVRQLREQIRLLQASGMHTEHSAVLERALTKALARPSYAELGEQVLHSRPATSSTGEEEGSEDGSGNVGASSASVSHRELLHGAVAAPNSADEYDAHPGSAQSIRDGLGHVDRKPSSERSWSEHPESEHPESVSSPLTAQVEMLQSALLHAEGVIRQLTQPDGKQSSSALTATGVLSPTFTADDNNKATDSTSSAQRGDQADEGRRTLTHRGKQAPFLLNMDGAGDWVVAYLGNAHRTWLGREDSEALAAARRCGDVYLAVPADRADGIVAGHLCFSLLPAGSVRVSTAAPNAQMTLNDGIPCTLPLEPGERIVAADGISLTQSPRGDADEVLLRHGDLVRVGTAPLTFRFTDPSAVQVVSTAHPTERARFSVVNGPTPPEPNDARAASSTHHNATSLLSRPDEGARDQRVDATRPRSVPVSDTDSNGTGHNSGRAGHNDVSDSPDVTPHPESIGPPGTSGVPVVIPRLSLAGLQRQPPTRAAPTVPGVESGAATNAPVGPLTSRDPRTASLKTGVDPLSALPLTARGKRVPQPSDSTARDGGVRHGRTHAVTATQAPMLLNEPARFVGQHTFCFVGPAGAGKTFTRENLRQPDRWLSFLLKPSTSHAPTWGLDRVAVDVDGQEDMRLILAELSGQPCFTLLTDFIPWKRVTFVLCFSLEHEPSIHDVRQTLEMILCHTERRPLSLLLVATHMDKCEMSRSSLNRLLDDLESQVRNLCVMLQRNPELRPVIVGRAAVNNVTREVLMSGFGKVDSFPKLLTWLSDYAYHQCRNDPDFPNGLIPERCLQLRHHLRRLRLSRTLCLSARDYRQFAGTLYPKAYGLHGAAGDLASHTQLLASWGVVLHLAANARWRPLVLLDVQWLHLILTVVACLGRTAPAAEETQATSSRPPTHAVKTDAATPETPSIAPAVDVAQAQGSLMLSSTMMRRLVHHRGSGSPGREIPFHPQKVITADTFGLLRHSIPTVPVLSVLMEKLILERGDADACHLSGIVEVLENCDTLIRGSRLLYSPTQCRYRLSREGSKHPTESQMRGSEGPMDESDEDTTTDTEWAAAQQREFFFLLPFTFDTPAPAPVVQHFAKFLSGPFYRFTFNVIPPLFFAKLISRLASTTPASTSAGPAREEVPTPKTPTTQKKVYVGPLDPILVNTDGAVLDAAGGAAAAGRAASPLSRPLQKRVIIPSGPLAPWATCAWVAADGDDDNDTACSARFERTEQRPSRSRVLLRLVHHSLFLSFHNVYETVHHHHPQVSHAQTAVGGSVSSSSVDSFLMETDMSDNDYDDELSLETSTSQRDEGCAESSPTSPRGGHTRLRDAAFFQSVLDTVRDIAEEYPGTMCEESILSTTSSHPQPYDEAWLEETETHGAAGAADGAVPPPQYRTVDINLNSTDRVKAREEAGLLTTRVSRSQPRENDEPGDAEEAADTFPFLRGYSVHTRTRSCRQVPEHSRVCSTEPVPIAQAEEILTAVPRRPLPVTNSLSASGATLHEVLVALNEALCHNDAVQHSLIVDALLDVLARTDHTQ